MLLLLLQFLMLVLVLLHIVGVVFAGVAFSETDCRSCWVVAVVNS
jgi:hypothetical protein